MISNELKTLADEIVKYEKEIKAGNNVQINQQKIEDIISSLSFKDIISMDEYICSKNN